MDPLAHTLFGAALAEAGLKRASRGATAALLLGANLPDLDGLAYFLGSDTALYLRRGWSHGLMAMALLPLLLAALLLLWSRWRAPREGGPPTRAGALLAMACLAVWSHPLLDWMNTYGVRLLMPFDGRWFYGDALFIVDPWLWLLLAAGVVVGRSTRWPARAGWLLLAGAASWLLLSRGMPAAVLLAWTLGLAGVLALRAWLPAAAAPRVAQCGLALALGYGVLMFGLARHAEARALLRFPAAVAAQASPVAAVPGRHRVLLVEPGAYRVLLPDGTDRLFPRSPMGPTVRAALADPALRGFASWMRFPWWETAPAPEGTRVRFHDLRYSLPGTRGGGIGYAEVVVQGQRPFAAAPVQAAAR